jgi:CDP-paratose 2-epimerase
MKTAIITGSGGLIGSEAALFFAQQGFQIVGIDNDMRATFFGKEASTAWNQERLQCLLKTQYCHINGDIRDRDLINSVFQQYEREISVIIHTAAQPSHDWAVRDPHVDFTVNANGTLNLLEATRLYAPEAPFIFTSTNKVYGDSPNALPLIEESTRWEIEAGHVYQSGISEEMSIDQTLHSLFGASKVAADILVQEYGRYFDMPTVSFRCGCLTGPSHSGAELHGFLAYLMQCTQTGKPYTVYGYKGKQVRDNIHSVDLIGAFYEFYKSPRSAEVYNIGGGRYSNCSMLEAIEYCEQIADKKLTWHYADKNRVGDHMWWISDNEKFRQHYPNWQQTYSVAQILEDIHAENCRRWAVEAVA